MTIQNGYKIYRPGRRERIFKWLGWDWFIPPQLPPEHATEHVVRVITNLRFSWPDRLRFLLTGRLQTLSWVHCDVEVKDAHTRTLFRIMPPGEQP